MDWRTMPGRRARAVVAAWALTTACGAPLGEDGPLHVECNEACECLDPEVCLGPWPSDRYQEDDPTTATGRRVAVPEDAMMRTRGRGPVDPGPWNEGDGFSPLTSLIARFATPIDTTVLPGWRDEAPGLADGSPVVLIAASTGERVACFLELEEAEDTDPDAATLYVRPMARLAEGRRYVVGLRGLVTPDGAPVPSPIGFAALRDGVITDHPQLEARRPRFDAEVFAPLEAAGVARDDLILAWDFSTGSGPAAWGELAAMARTALAIAGSEGLGCAVTRVDESAEGYRVIDGTFTVPRFLASDEVGAPMLRDLEGRPMADGTMQADFRAVVPGAVIDAVRAGGDPAAVVLYGHGLFDDRAKVSAPGGDGRAPPREVMDRCGGQVWVATDFLGLTMDDVPLALQALSDLERFDGFFDRVRQGLVNTLLLPRTFAHQCAALPELRVDGSPVVGATEAYYYGNSQGAILGTTLAALTPDIDRWALGVGGVSYPIMLQRSIQWPSLEDILARAYPDRLTRDLAMVMFSQRWDLVEGGSLAPHVLRDPIEGLRETPARVLFQVGLHDVQTTNLASDVAARSLGLPEPEGTAHPVWGLARFSGASDSGYIVYDVGAAPAPLGTRPPEEDNGVHEAVRRLDAAQEQVCRFLRPDGRVTAP